MSGSDDEPEIAAAPARPTRQLQLEAEIDVLRARRLEIAARQRETELERASAAADMEEAAALGDAERRRLQTDLENAQRAAMDGSSYRQRQLLDAEAEVAELEPRLITEGAQRQRQYADLNASVSAFMTEASELDQQIAARADELRHLVDADQARRARDLEAQIEQLAPLVDAQREAVGITASADLSEDYIKQADDHAEAWKKWGGALVISVAVAILVGLLLFRQDSVPSGKLTNGAVVEVARNLVIIGLLIYLVRLTALQFRVHRHLEAVARNKAAALSTFNRMVAVASEPEVRNSLATVLAQSVFSSDESGFIDATGDHVTLIERFAGSITRPAT